MGTPITTKEAGKILWDKYGRKRAWYYQNKKKESVMKKVYEGYIEKAKIKDMFPIWDNDEEWDTLESSPTCQSEVYKSKKHYARNKIRITVEIERIKDKE